MTNEKINNVIEFLSEHETYIDTNVLMNEGFAKMLRYILPEMRRKNVKLYIPFPVYNELKKLSCSEDKVTSDSAKFGIKSLEALKALYVAEMVDNPNNYGLATQFLIKTVIKYRARKNLAVITCNKKLAEDILMQNSLKSVNGNYTYCLDLSRNGYLYNYDSTVDASNTDSDKYSKNTEDNIDDNILKLFGLQ